MQSLTFRCPLEVGPRTEDWIVRRRYATSYLGNAGSDVTIDDLSSSVTDMSRSNGVLLVAKCWGSFSAVRMGDVIDGTSTTFLPGEAKYLSKASLGCGFWHRFYLYHPEFDS